MDVLLRFVFMVAIFQPIFCEDTFFDMDKCMQSNSAEECAAECQESTCDGDENCANACVKSANGIQNCIDTGSNEGCCKKTEQGSASSHLRCSTYPEQFKGKDDIVPSKNCPEKCANEEGCECDVSEQREVGKRRKKRAKGRNGPLNIDFDPLFIWHADVPDDLVEKKKRKCCITVSRVVPFTWKIKKNVWPVFCPLLGGYQWIDQVVCNIKNKKDMLKYQIPGLSKGKKCKKPRCEVQCTMRTYLVTNVKPMGFWGHCFYFFLPVWFKNVNVDTHCICPVIAGGERKC